MTLERVKNFLDIACAYCAATIKEDGYFFVVLTILNLPIIFFGGNFRTSIYLFWLGAFVIFAFTVATHLLPLKIRRALQTAMIIIFAVIFAANVFLLYKFGVPLNMDMLQIVMGTNPIETQEFFRTYFTNFKILGSLTAFVIALVALSLGLKKIFATRSPERLRRLTFDALIIFAMPFIVYTCNLLGIWRDLPEYMFINTTPWLTIKLVVELAETTPMGDDSKILAAMDKNLETEELLRDDSNIPWVVFILGESTDRNHMQLYGYRLPTTPLLSTRHERGEIFRFNDTIACANNTSPAMSKIFTFAEKDDPKNDWYLKANIFDIVRRAGYHMI